MCSRKLFNLYGKPTTGNFIRNSISCATGNLMGIVGMLVFIPLLSVLYTIFREFVYLRLKKQNIKQVTKTEIEEYTKEEDIEETEKSKL